MVISVFAGDRNSLLALPPHPSPLPQGGEGEREPICMLFRSCVQLGLSSRRTSFKHFGHLSPRERGKGSRFVRLSNLAFNSVFQVGAPRSNTSVSRLYPREREKGSRFVCFSDLAFNSVFQVGVTCASNAVSPLSPRERGKGADLCAFQILRSTRYFKSAHLVRATRSVPSPSGRGLG
jgi:hypothetical protein